MVEEGYAAVTTRRVAARAGLKPQLVHYYFRSMDELLLSVLRRAATASREHIARALASPKPLRALWEFSSDPAVTALTVEFMGLANHRKTIRAELAAYGEELRRMQAKALTDVLKKYGISDEHFPADVVTVLITSVSQVLLMEQALGVVAGHKKTRALVEHFLTEYEGGSSDES